MSIREIEPRDFDDIVSCYYSYYDELGTNPDLGVGLLEKKPSLGDELEWFAQIYKNMEEGNGIVLVAEEDSKVVGMCEVRRRGRKGSEASHRAELGIAIRKEYRGRGIGASLLEEMLKRCKERFEIIELSVFTTNKGAKKLYERFGFKEVGLRPRAIKRRGRYYDEYLMSLFF